MKVIIAPNSFKGSLNAFQVAQAIESGLLKSKIEVDCHLFPIADGGDHTLEVFCNWFQGVMKSNIVQGPMSRKIDAEWATVEEGKTAISEMAKASGISLVENKNLDQVIGNS